MNTTLDSRVASSRADAGSDAILPDTFPAKTYLMIENCDREDAKVACWNDDGDAFVVKDTVKFAANHLPQYFKHSNFQSFIRQLNLYGFRNIRSKDGAKKINKMIFRHEHFRRGRRDLLETIQRAKKGSRSTGKASSTAVVEKKEEEPSLLALSSQIQEMSLKLDLMLSLMTNQKPHSIESLTAWEVYQNGKRRRQEIGEYRIGSPASVSDVSLDSQTYNSTTAQDSHPIGAVSRMDVVEEQKEYEPIEYGQEARASIGELDPLDNDEFTEFIDNMLDNDDEVMVGASELGFTPQNGLDMEVQTTAANEESNAELDRRDDPIISSASDEAAATHQDPDRDACGSPPDFTEEAEADEECGRGGEATGSLDRSGENDESALISDAVANKIHPATVGGVQQQYTNNDATIDAVVTTAERVDYEGADEENGFHSSPPLAEAVEVTEDSSLRGFLGRCRGYRLYLALAAILVLLGFTVAWPVANHVHRKKIDRRKPPPKPPRQPGGGNKNGKKENTNDKWEEQRNSTGAFDEDGDNPDTDPSLDQRIFVRNRPKESEAQSAAAFHPPVDVSDMVELALNGMRFQCQQLDGV